MPASLRLGSFSSSSANQAPRRAAKRSAKQRAIASTSSTLPIRKRTDRVHFVHFAGRKRRNGVRFVHFASDTERFSTATG